MGDGGGGGGDGRAPGRKRARASRARTICSVNGGGGGGGRGGRVGRSRVRPSAHGERKDDKTTAAWKVGGRARYKTRTSLRRGRAAEGRQDGRGGGRETKDAARALLRRPAHVRRRAEGPTESAREVRRYIVIYMYARLAPLPVRRRRRHNRAEYADGLRGVSGRHK